MLFTKAVIKYKATVASTSGARDYVQDLIRNYVAEGSSFEINVSAALRTETLEHIQTALASTTDGTLPTDLFDKVCLLENWRDLKQNSCASLVLDLSTWPALSVDLLSSRAVSFIHWS